jgi:large subunit ribosomal protein L25
MDAIKLEAKSRTGTGKGVNRRLRGEGWVPGVIYGGTEEGVMIQVPPAPLVGMFQGEAGQNQLLEVEIDGKPGPTVIMCDYQLHPVRRTLLHVDFLRVSPDKPVKVLVPIKVVGKSEAVKQGGKQRLVANEITVKCMPQDIPLAIVYDVSSIDKTKVVYVTDLEFPAGVEPVFRRKFPVISITLQRVAAAAPEAPAKKK